MTTLKSEFQHLQDQSPNVSRNTCSTGLWRKSSPGNLGLNPGSQAKTSEISAAQSRRANRSHTPKALSGETGCPPPPIVQWFPLPIVLYLSFTHAYGVTLVGTSWEPHGNTWSPTAGDTWDLPPPNGRASRSHLGLLGLPGMTLIPQAEPE